MINGSEFKVTFVKNQDMFTATYYKNDDNNDKDNSIFILPEIGSTVLIGNVWYKVTYVNKGQKRISLKKL